MKLTSLFGKERVFFIEEGDKEKALRELVKKLKKEKIITKENQIFEKVKEREKLGSTSIGRAIAIPHCKLKGLKDPIVAIGISKRGIDYHSIDGKPVNLLIFVASPLENPTLHLQILASAAHLAKNISSNLKELLETNSKDEIYELLRNAEYTDT